MSIPDNINIKGKTITADALLTQRENEIQSIKKVVKQAEKLLME